jgi:ATP-binding protein involved in chromosome partitioning
MWHYGVQAMSVGFLIDPDTPMVWRGPMAAPRRSTSCSTRRAGRNSITWWSTCRREPATSSSPWQKVPVTGAVIVTTPQDIALLDARKGLKMFEKVGIPILGIVENMSTHICSNCGHQEHIFGEGGGARMCATTAPS